MRLTREEFIGLARLRGYSLAAVARLWGLSRSRISQIAADTHRPMHWDYALWGLPARNATARVEARRLRLLPSLRDNGPRRHRFPSPPALHEIGDIWLVRDSPGEHLLEGAEGIVQNLFVRDGDWHANLYFPATAYQESFTLTYLQSAHCFLVQTGRNARSDASTHLSEP